MYRVFYLMSGPAHLPYLVASLHTLRKHWDGRVSVFAYPESAEVVEQIAADPRLNIEAIRFDPWYTGKNSQFLNKIRLAQSLEGDTALYLDADTTIHGSLGGVFYYADLHGFAATQFSDWKVSGGIIRRRLKTLEAFPEIDQGYLKMVFEGNYPSVNGGVWCSKSNSVVLETWLQWSLAARSTFICDEKVLHLMLPKYALTHLSVLSGKYNCSHRYQPSDLDDEDVIIYHYHGDSCVRPNKSPRGYAMWWPIYQECIKNRVGNIDQWMSQVVPTNKWIMELVRDHVVSVNNEGIPI